MSDPLQVENAGIQAVFTFLTVQFYVAGPSDPSRSMSTGVASARGQVDLFMVQAFGSSRGLFL
jgi:hypothetical protein